jgi:hypothetical protein
VRRSEVRALLEKARATLECDGFGDCPMSNAACATFADDGWPGWLRMGHLGFASALLDGLDVDLLTEAGG